MTKYHLAIGLTASITTALIFSLPEQACKLSGGRKAAEAAAVIATLTKSSKENNPVASHLPQNTEIKLISLN